jgi:hypothetical protein
MWLIPSASAQAQCSQATGNLDVSSLCHVHQCVSWPRPCRGWGGVRLRTEANWNVAARMGVDIPAGGSPGSLRLRGQERTRRRSRRRPCPGLRSNSVQATVTASLSASSWCACSYSGATAFIVLADYAERIRAGSGHPFLSGVGPDLLEQLQHTHHVDLRDAVTVVAASDIILESTQKAHDDAGVARRSRWSDAR